MVNAYKIAAVPEDQQTEGSVDEVLSPELNGPPTLAENASQQIIAGHYRSCTLGDEFCELNVDVFC